MRPKYLIGLDGWNLKNQSIHIGLTVVIFSIVLIGCGSQKISIAADMRDFSYQQPEWTVPASSEVTLTLANTGTQEHEWVIMKAGAEVSIPFNNDDEANVFWEGEVEPGEEGTFTFTAPSTPGEYQIVCGEPSHIEQGMIGKLIVTE
jgi:plastocyanin